MSLTERQKREQSYYNQFAEMFTLNENIDFSPILGKERRPWNSYWYIYQLAEEAAAGKVSPKLLDFGSGPGENALRFAKLGYEVEGFDISEKNIEAASGLFEKYEISGNFKVSVAEKLDYADETFDTIAGIDILHHVDIPLSIKECRRVLKPGGVAIFREPLDVPLWDKIRGLKLVTIFFSKSVSFEKHITEDERKLNQEDIRVLTEEFPDIKIDKFLIFSRFDPYLRKNHDSTPSLLEKFDAFLMRLIPGIANLGGAMVITLKKEK
ncbi:MAG: class I SAM-dependent methyltransferase [Gammaproteobacteria bacterium]|nr:class I SAM-dependent methyltransferase [Gammaproteobacteria bacterium]